ncbi:MAG: hypothetical protein CTY38_00875 [Methylotenera sp.]|uniref:hypothetical protein n=1 Tax=Methylotenera sp. TaxID=2051956 RepID=UPI000D4B1BCF|nr:hypothetical protein [Methylotenera sp.]PPC84631.1 MAG: hypothetical protein CTY38_00875 [Methylotenera sp.]
MKLPVLIFGLLSSGLSLASEVPDELISVETVLISNTPVQLEKTRTRSGLICQSYVAETKSNTEGVLVVEFDQICGKPMTVNANHLHMVYPENLHSMRFDQETGKHLLKHNN